MYLQENIQHYPLLPKQAFLIFPQGDMVYFQKKEQAKRLIYGDGRYPQYNEQQKAKINQFIKFLQKKDDVKQIVNPSQKTLFLRLIYANKLNFENAYQNFKQFKKWESLFMPLSNIAPDYKTKMDNLLKTGVFYVTPTRDQYFKPIVVVHVGRLLRVRPQKTLFLDTFGYFLQSVIEHMMIDGQVQTWNVIVDVDQASAFSFAGDLFDLIKFLSKTFMGRMFRCYVVDYPFLIKFVWGTVSLMMDKEQNDKTRVLPVSQLIKMIPKQTLQKKYGGILDPLEHFWPLDHPQRLRVQKQYQQNMRPHWIKSNTFITQEQYIERVKSDKIGNKKCRQIIQKHEKQMIKKAHLQNELKMEQQYKNRYKKLSPQQQQKLTSLIPSQQIPRRIKVITEVQSSQTMGEQFVFRKDRINAQRNNKDDPQNQPTKYFSNQQNSSVQYPLNQKTSFSNSNQKLQFQQQIKKQRRKSQIYQEIFAKKIDESFVFVRKEIFNQLTFKSIFNH